MRSRWVTVTISLVLLAAIVALHSWSLGTYAAMTRKHDSRPATLVRQLQQFREETSPDKRVALVQEFGRIQDPRVIVALMDAVQGELAKGQHTSVLVITSSTLVYYHIPKEELAPTKYWSAALIWWEKNEADVRRRAAALPQ